MIVLTFFFIVVYFDLVVSINSFDSNHHEDKNKSWHRSNKTRRKSPLWLSWHFFMLYILIWLFQNFAISAWSSNTTSKFALWSKLLYFVEQDTKMVLKWRASLYSDIDKHWSPVGVSGKPGQCLSSTLGENWKCVIMKY